MKSLNITCITSHLGSGGAERNLLRLAEWLAEGGHRVTVLTLDPDVADFYHPSPMVKRVVAGGDAFLSCRWFDFACQKRRKQALRRSLLATKPDLVISFIDTTNISVLAALRGTEIPAIVSERIDPGLHPIGWRWDLLRRLYYPSARKVVFVAQANLTWAGKMYPRWNSTAIANAVLAPDSQKQALPCFNRYNVITMGRLADQKGFDLLIQAFAGIADRFPEWNLIILGEGPLRPALEKLAAQQRLQQRAHLPGNMEQPDTVLQAADLFVLSSRYEGFPNALLEAMACGLPVISFDCPSGPREIITDGRDGLLIEAGNVQALQEAMQALMGDSDRRRQLAGNAPQVLERFSEQRIKGQWLSLIEDVMNC